MLGKNIDPESLYKSYVMIKPSYTQLLKNDETKQLMHAEHKVNDNSFAFIMGHGHDADLSGFDYDQLLPLIEKYQKVAITGCGQNWEIAEKHFWSTWKCEVNSCDGCAARCPKKNAGKDRWLPCLVLDKTWRWKVREDVPKCKQIADEIKSGAKTTDPKQMFTEFEMWQIAENFVLPKIEKFRSRVVFMTDRVLNWVWDPTGNTLNIWLTPNNEQAVALKRASVTSAEKLEWQMDYKKLQYPGGASPIVTDAQIAAFRAGGGQGEAFYREWKSITTKNDKDADFKSNTRMITVYPLRDIPTLIETLLSATPFNIAYLSIIRNQRSLIQHDETIRKLKRRARHTTNNKKQRHQQLHP